MSTATRFRLTDELFRAAVRQGADERGAFLDRECRDDPALKAAVLALLREDERVEGTLDQPAFDSAVLRASIAAQEPADAVPPPEMIGRYRIVRELGRGGMGIVYEAIQENPRRTVALKVISAGVGARGLLRRFEQEAAALGRLQHAGIAQIHEAGTFEIGARVQPYFAMEFVRGQPLLEYAAARSLDTRDRLGLIARLCDAVEHAHQHGVIHRDLKPSNILVVDDDSSASKGAGSRGTIVLGQPKILDFGVARLTDNDTIATTLQTDVGQLVGTVQYMSPEQAAGDPRKIDTRSDVYSLGVLAYELMTGRLPYRLQDKLVHEAVRVIREDDPTPMSSINRTFRGDIQTIIAKALEKDPARRYQSAGELAADIRRFLRDEPIVARPTSTMYQLRKFARRNKAIVGSVAVAFAALSIGTVVAVRQAIVAERARADEHRLRGEAERQAYRASLVAASSALRYHEAVDARRHLDAAPEHLHGWEWDHLSSHVDHSVMQLKVGFVPMAAAVSPDGRTLAVCNSGGKIRTWRLPEFMPAESYSIVGGLAQRRVVRLTYSRDGAELTAEAREGATRLSARTMEVLAQDTLPARARSIDGRFALLIKDAEIDQVALVHIADDRRLLEFDCQDAFESVMVFSPDGEHVAICLRGQSGLTIHRTADGSVVCRRPDLDQIIALSFSADGSRIAVAGMSGGAGVIDASTGRDLFLLRGHPAAIAAIAYGPDDTIIATVSGDRAVRLWRADDGSPLAAMHGNQDRLTDLEFAADGAWVVTATADGVIRWWDARRTSDPFVLRTSGTVYGLAFTADGSRIVAASLGGDRPLRVWDAADGAEILAVGDGHLSALAISPDGTRIAVGRSTTAPSTIYGLDGSVLTTLGGHWWRTDWLAFIDDGANLLSLGNGGRLLTHDALSGRQVRRKDFTPEAQGEGCRAAISPDGSLIAVASKQDIHLLDADTWESTGTMHADAGNIYAIAFSPDGGRLVTGSSDHALRVWDVAARRWFKTLHGHSDDVYAVAFSPDGKRLFSAGRDRVIRVWDAQRLEEITQLHGHTSLIYCMAFSPDGRTLASGGGDASVRLWGTRPAHSRLGRGEDGH